jgi:hypothetical protein
VQIKIVVDDGKKTDSTSFQLNIAPINDPPVVKVPDTIRTREDITAGPLGMRIFDQETDTDQLELEIETTNERLVSREDIHVEGAGADKQLYISSKKNQYGSTNLIFRVSDGTLADTARAYFYVKPVNDSPATFSLYNSNLEQDFDSVRVAFKWEQAEDVDDDNIEYIFHLEGTALDTVIEKIHQNSYTFRTVDALKPNDEYQWKVLATDGKDTTQSKSSKQFLTPDLDQRPGDFKLYSNYPNPFNPKTNIKYKIPVRSRVRVSVYDMSGRMITRLIDKVQTPGDYEVSWNA